MQRTREGCLVDAKLIAHVRTEPIVRTQLLRDFHRKSIVETPLDVDRRQLAQLGPRLPRQLAHFPRDVRPLCIALRADRDVFADSHRHGSRDQAGHAGDQGGPP